MGSERIFPGRDADSGSGGGTGGGGGGYRWGGKGDRKIISWEDTVSNLILWVEPNSPLTYGPLLELHHPVMSMLGGNGGWLEIYRDAVNFLGMAF